MANAGGAWDNAKKVVEVDLREKGTALHEASIVGDTVGDPFKDTSSVALNPISSSPLFSVYWPWKLPFPKVFILLHPMLVGYFLQSHYTLFPFFYKMRIVK